MKKILKFLAVWFKHAMLNVGELLREGIWVCWGPGKMSVRRSLVHRSKRMFEALVFGIVLPPQTHHTPDECDEIGARSALDWFWDAVTQWPLEKHPLFKRR